MAIKLSCPGCRAVFQLDDKLAGKTLKCQKCQTAFRVPGNPVAAPAANAAPPASPAAPPKPVVAAVPAAPATAPSAPRAAAPAAPAARPAAAAVAVPPAAPIAAGPPPLAAVPAAITRPAPPVLTPVAPPMPPNFSPPPATPLSLPAEFAFRKKEVLTTLAWAAGATFAALLLFLWSAFQWADRPGPNSANYASRAFLAGVAVLVVSGLLWVQVVAQALQKFRVLPGGFILQSPLYRNGVRWSEVDELAYSEPSRVIAVLARQTPPELLRIPAKGVERGDELGRVMLDRARAALVPQLVARLRQGETIPLGRAQLHPGGVTYYRGAFASTKTPSLYRGPFPTGNQRQQVAQQTGNQLYQFPWHDFLNVQTNHLGNVVVQTPQVMVDLQCAPEDVPNLFAVPEVARVMRGQPSAYLTQPDPGLAEPLPEHRKKDITMLVRGIVSGVCIVLGLGVLVIIMGLGRRGGPDNAKKEDDNPPVEAKLEPPEKHLEFKVDGTLRRVAFHEQGNKILACVTGPGGTKIKQWDTFDGKEIAPWFTTDETVHDFALSDTGQRLVLACGDKGVKVYEHKEKQWDFPVEGVARRVALSPDMNWVVASVTDAAGKNEWIKVWDLGAKKLAWSDGPLPLPADNAAGDNPTQRVAISGINKLLFGTGKAGEILVRELGTGQEQKTTVDKLGPIRLVTLDRRDMKTVAAVGAGSAAAALGAGADLKSLKPLAGGPDSACLCAGLSFEGKVLATGHAGGQVYLWDVAKQAELQHLDNIGGPCHFVAVSPANNYLLTAGPTIQLWKVEEILRRP